MAKITIYLDIENINDKEAISKILTKYQKEGNEVKKTAVFSNTNNKKKMDEIMDELGFKDLYQMGNEENVSDIRIMYEVHEDLNKDFDLAVIISNDKDYLALKRVFKNKNNDKELIIESVDTSKQNKEDSNISLDNKNKKLSCKKRQSQYKQIIDDILEKENPIDSEKLMEQVKKVVKEKKLKVSKKWLKLDFLIKTLGYKVDENKKVTK